MTRLNLIVLAVVAVLLLAAAAIDETREWTEVRTGHERHVARPAAGVNIETLVYGEAWEQLRVAAHAAYGELIESELGRREAERVAAEAAAQTRIGGVVRGVPSASTGTCGGDWECFRECTIDHESRNAGVYGANTGNGYFGAFQFLQSTWDAVAVNAGYGEWAGRPASEAPPEVQDAVARFLWEHSGTRPWGGRCG